MDGHPCCVFVFLCSLRLSYLISEFSESLRELGDCLLEKTALNDDEESGKLILTLIMFYF